MIPKIVYVFFILFNSIGNFIFYKYIRPGTFNKKVILHNLLFFCIIGSIDLRFTSLNNKFIEKESHSKIVDRFRWSPTLKEFILKSNTKLTSSLDDYDLLIGDSIVKGANTTIFDVYKKDYNGKYVFYKRYDYNLSK